MNGRFLKYFLCAVAICSHSYKIGVVMPMEHESLHKIVQGIKNNLNDTDIIVQNAGGDMSLMSALFNQMNNENFDVVVPIGTNTSQMALSILKNMPVVCAAANSSCKRNNSVGVNDEMTHAIMKHFPSIKKLAIIYSPSEKTSNDVNALKDSITDKTIELVQVNSTIDLSTIVNNLSNDIEAFIITKDHLIVSAINILIDEAKRRKIPIIALDEGSVIKGATIAIGVREEDIGSKTADIINTIRGGKQVSEMPWLDMNELCLFINDKAFADQNIIEEKDILSDGLRIVHIEG